jgi:hypothetical protein
MAAARKSPIERLTDINPEKAASGDYSLAGVVKIVPVKAARALRKAQEADYTAEGRVTDEWLEPVEGKIPELLGYLHANTELYEEHDGVEELLDADPIIAELMSKHDFYRNDTNYVALMSLRRTVVLRNALEDMRIYQRGIAAVGDAA